MNKRMDGWINGYVTYGNKRGREKDVESKGSLEENG